jgi:hypothetical protein
MHLDTRASAMLALLRQVKPMKSPSQLGNHLLKICGMPRARDWFYLEQKIEGKTSMTRTKESFTP